jgi:hypothetical protein
MKYITFLIMSLDTEVLLLDLGWEMAKRSPALVEWINHMGMF